MSLDYDYHKVANKVQRVGYEFLGTKETDDSNILVVLAHSCKKKEYVTWLFNKESCELFSGEYFGYYFSDDDKEAKDMAYRSLSERD